MNVVSNNFQLSGVASIEIKLISYPFSANEKLGVEGRVNPSPMI